MGLMVLDVLLRKLSSFPSPLSSLIWCVWILSHEELDTHNLSGTSMLWWKAFLDLKVKSTLTPILSILVSGGKLIVLLMLVKPDWVMFDIGIERCCIHSSSSEATWEETPCSLFESSNYHFFLWGFGGITYFIPKDLNIRKTWWVEFF